MRQLRLVTLAEDGSHLVLEAPGEDERLALPVDAALREHVGAARPTPSPAGPPVAAADSQARAGTDTGANPGSGTGLRTGFGAGDNPGDNPVEAPLGPREIQVRVRAGESPESIAAAHGMSLERVMRFAGAAVEERRRIAGEARRARARRSTPEGQPVVFGEAVDARFAAHGIDAAGVEWDARRRDDGEWTVAARWHGGEGLHDAQWLFHRSSRSVTPVDDAAADLLSDRPIRAVPVATRPTLVAAPPLERGVVAFPPMPDAHTGPMPRVEDVFDQEAPTDVAAIKPAPAAARAELGLPARAGSTVFEEPPLPLGIVDPGTRPGAAATVDAVRFGPVRRPESDDDRAARARVPSWDDILLGVRRKTD